MELKFRAWDKEDCVMFSNFDINHINFRDELIDIDSGEYEFIGDFGKNGTMELMQYTGLKDRNGVEVYNDYIIENTFLNIKCIVGFKNGAFTKSWKNSNIHLLYDSNIEDGKLIDWRVIGNIYENPDLLEEVCKL